MLHSTRQRTKWLDFYKSTCCKSYCSIDQNIYDGRANCSKWLVFVLYMHNF